ncbi:MAG: MASE1 domain-containing protein, partial [Gemmatimonadales bacterium]
MRLRRRLALLVAVATIYVVAGKLGLRLGIVNPSASAVWAPTGIALAACILLGTMVWPAILLGAFVVNYTTTGGLVVSLAIATGNTLEAVIGAWLVGRWARGRHAFDSGDTAIRYAILAGLGATLVSATLGVTALTLKGLASWPNFSDIWFTWWLGDAAGALIVAPPIILWATNWKVTWPRVRWLEVGALVASLVVVSLLAFDGRTLDITGGHTLGFLVVPVLIWAAVRFDPREAATAVAIVAAIAVGAAVAPGRPDNTTLILLQSFVAVIDVTILVLAAAVAERRSIERQLRQLSVTDPLTGLANYRQLITATETELQRSGRSERPFAILLFDLDRLKKVNDRYGHLVGSRALCRL